MPKLNPTLASATDEVEVQDFSAFPAGLYTAKLLEVEQKEGKTSKKPYWNWTFEVTEEGPAKGRRLWVMTSLSENALFKLKEVFLAFGYTTDSDTDEMIGDEVKLQVSEIVIEQGKRKGQTGNQVEFVYPLTGPPTSDGSTPAPAGKATASDDDLFDEK